MSAHPKIPQPEARRANLGIYTFTDAQGKIIPMRIRWEDGREWEIDRVLGFRPAAARKAGGVSVRYLVRIGERQREIFLVDNRWFIEVPN